jgi:hypothetical protein
MNRRFTKFEIWLRTHEQFEINIVLTIVLSLIILVSLWVIEAGFKNDDKMEAIKIIQYQESIK